MTSVASGSVLARRRAPETDLHAARLSRTAVLLIAVFLAAVVALSNVKSASLVPMMWPAAGLAAGLYLTTARRLRFLVLVLVFLLVMLAHVLYGLGVRESFGFSATCVAAVATCRLTLVAGRADARVALLDYGDVSRLIGAAVLSSLVAAAGCAATDVWVGAGNAALGAVAAFGAYGAAMMVLLPLFLRTLEFEVLATRGERVAQSTILLVTTLCVFIPVGIPPVFFALMPMFAWYAYRGSLREATVLLATVGLIATFLTLAGLGPVVGMQERYDLPPEIVNGVLQLFLVDCGLVLLPLSVIVTQQRIAAGRADAEGATLRHLVSSASGTAIVATGRDGKIEVFNPAAELMFGWAAEDVFGQRPELLIPEVELRGQAAALGVEARFEDVCRAWVMADLGSRLWAFVRRDGQERTMRIAFNALHDELGQLRGYIAIAEDVTEREARERALLETLESHRAAVERLQELERIKEDFVSTVSHELRTPITTIIGYAEVLSDGMVGGLNEDQSEVVDRLERNGVRLLQLVEDLLTISEIEASRVRIEPVPTDFAEVFRGAVQDLAATLEKRSLEVVLEVPAGPMMMQGDPLQLRRMVAHLLINAVKFTADGGVVSANAEQLGGEVCLVVSDSGIGIAPEDQERLFTRFFRSRAATAMAIQGTGLGLTIVHSIVAMHGGTIGVTSAEGEGTTVTVSLPESPDQTSEDPTDPASLAEAS